MRASQSAGDLGMTENAGLGKGRKADCVKDSSQQERRNSDRPEAGEAQHRVLGPGKCIPFQIAQDTAANQVATKHEEDYNCCMSEPRCVIRMDNEVGSFAGC